MLSYEIPRRQFPYQAQFRRVNPRICPLCLERIQTLLAVSAPKEALHGKSHMDALNLEELKAKWLQVSMVKLLPEEWASELLYHQVFTTGQNFNRALCLRFRVFVTNTECKARPVKQEIEPFLHPQKLRNYEIDQGLQSLSRLHPDFELPSMMWIRQ